MNCNTVIRIDMSFRTDICFPFVLKVNMIWTFPLEIHLYKFVQNHVMYSQSLVNTLLVSSEVRITSQAGRAEPELTRITVSVFLTADTSTDIRVRGVYCALT